MTASIVQLISPFPPFAVLDPNQGGTGVTLEGVPANYVLLTDANENWTLIPASSLPAPPPTGALLVVNNLSDVASLTTSVNNLFGAASTGTGGAVRATSPTLVSPALGTPTALVGTNITGTAAGLTAGNVTTNANLTGPITSTGNVTAIASQTGTGTKFVVDTSPTLVTPVLGVATATSVNKITLTAPATGATLTIADGKTLTASNSITLAGTDSTTMTFPPASASIGYLDVPQNSQSANYTTVLADAGKSIDHPSTDANARTFTIDSNANVAYPVGTCIGFSNMTANNVTIAITSDTLYLAGTGSTGSRTLAQYGVAVARKLTSTTWLISGTGLT